MVLNYEITPSDHLEMLKVRFGLRARLGRILIGVAGIVLGALCCYVFGETWLVVVAVFTGLTIVQILFPYIVHRRIYSRNPQLFELRTVTIAGEGLKSEKASGTVEIKWTAFEKF